jgi:hypothetical protein
VEEAILEGGLSKFSKLPRQISFVFNSLADKRAPFCEIKKMSIYFPGATRQQNFPKHRYASRSCPERLLQVGVQGIHDRKTVVTRIGFQQAPSDQHVDFCFA